MRCTLLVNTGACLSRRRVGTGVFTNRACASNRNRNGHLQWEEGDRLICNGIFINTFGLLLWIIYRRSSMDFIREILIECIICQIQPQAVYFLDFFVILTILFQYRMCICIWYNLYKHINLMICWNLGLWSHIYRYRINIYLLYSVCVYGNIPCNMTYTRLSL